MSDERDYVLSDEGERGYITDSDSPDVEGHVLEAEAVREDEEPEVEGHWVASDDGS